MCCLAAMHRIGLGTVLLENIPAASALVRPIGGHSLSDAINAFLVKSVEVGGLPFSMRSEGPSYDQVQKLAFRAPLDASGIAVLPSDWDDDDE